MKYGTINGNAHAALTLCANGTWPSDADNVTAFLRLITASRMLRYTRIVLLQTLDDYIPTAERYDLDCYDSGVHIYAGRGIEIATAEQFAAADSGNQAA